MLKNFQKGVVLLKKLKDISLLVSILAFLPILFGCATLQRQSLVFGPTKKDEISVSISSKKSKNLAPVAKKEEVDPEKMNKSELLEYCKKLSGKPTKEIKPESANSESSISLSFKVKNATRQTLFVTCFAYLQKHSYSAWRWDKSPIYELKPNQEELVEIDKTFSKNVAEGIYGYLAIFNSYQEAESSTYELLDDSKKLDLDLLYKIGQNTVNIEVEKYGVEAQIFDYQLTGRQVEQLGYQPELDFFVENKTGKTIHLTCFVYEQQQDSIETSVWKYVKTPVQTLDDGEIGIIDIASMRDAYDVLYTRGTLGVFDEGEEELANQSTFQLIPENKKVKLDRLSALRGKKVVLTVEKYGSNGEFLDYVIKTKPRKTNP